MLWYRKKIGVYDLQIWERAVELQEKNFKGIKAELKEESRLKADLIDVDLVRGSTFSKNKPQHHTSLIVWMSLVRMLLLPLFFKWWIQQANLTVFLFLLFLYLSQLLCLFLYASLPVATLHEVSVSELVLPSILMLTLGLIHCQVVSTNFASYKCTDEMLQKRTLSKALLEPADSDDCTQALSYVTSSVRDITSDSKKFSRVSSNAKNSCDVERDHVDDEDAKSDGVKSDDDKDDDVKDDDVLLENIDESYASDSSYGDACECGYHPIKGSPYLSATALLPCATPSSDRINVRIWESGKWRKCNASLIHIGGMIIKKVDAIPTHPDDYCSIAILFSMIIAFLPSIYRFFQRSVNPVMTYCALIQRACSAMFGSSSYAASFILMNAFVQRLLLTGVFYIMLCAAQQTYRKRFLYAKYFTHVTSSRRAKKSLVPHFRLNKVQNIRVWLALRSYLRRRGPQRSVDVIVSSSFLSSLCLLCFITVHLMNSNEVFVASLMYWDCLIFLLSLAIFILHFITIGSKINKKYTSISTLLTEQINLHLQMERKPHKKERLHRANSVLTLAAKLIKEIEEPFNIYGLAMNPILYNITRVVLLSAFSGVVSEMLGFKLKIWKIKA